MPHSCAAFSRACPTCPLALTLLCAARTPRPRARPWLRISSTSVLHRPAMRQNADQVGALR
eukprot:7094349-Alexandrium_andersonii.AAC.1